jgi:hypothetical protein
MHIGNFYYTAAKNGDGIRFLSLKGCLKNPVTPGYTIKKTIDRYRRLPGKRYISSVFPDSLVIAIKNIQEQFGLMPTGRIY